MASRGMRCFGKMRGSFLLMRIKCGIAMSQRQLLVTAALPYANGPIHIGHLVEYILTDTWIRFQRMQGHRAIYICADDTHGTAIMIRARQEGRSEEELIADVREDHIRDFAGFDIQFDNYGSTNSSENRDLCGQIWRELRSAELIVEKEVTQLFDPEAGTFLADRFVRGTCPNCAATNQPGDNCAKCGTTYSPIDLLDPVSTLSGATPETRSGESPVRATGKATRFFGRLVTVGRSPTNRSCKLPEGPFSECPPARLGHFSTGAVLRIRDSR